VSFIDKFRAYREDSGLMWRVEPICEVLTKNYGVSASPSSYYAFKHRGKSARAVEDERLSVRIFDKTQIRRPEAGQTVGRGLHICARPDRLVLEPVFNNHPKGADITHISNSLEEKHEI
jgi:hypothetical protein